MLLNSCCDRRIQQHGVWRNKLFIASVIATSTMFIIAGASLLLCDASVFDSMPGKFGFPTKSTWVGSANIGIILVSFGIGIAISVLNAAVMCYGAIKSSYKIGLAGSDFKKIPWLHALLVVYVVYRSLRWLHAATLHLLYVPVIFYNTIMSCPQFTIAMLMVTCTVVIAIIEIWLLWAAYHWYKAGRHDSSQN